MKRYLCLLAPLSLLAALTFAQDQPAATPDEELGLAKGSVFDVLTPEAVRPETSDPGDKPILPRDFEGSPPRVSHGIADFLPITREDNLCVDCHGIAEAEEGDPTPIPASHYTDLRRTPDRVDEMVAGARWVCVSCHVALTGAERLVDNRSIKPVSAEKTEEGQP
jgi:nitrate reductase cytochrome c-type subunit